MTMCAKGLAKLIEECGELVQVAGKKLACFWTDTHWDVGPPLSERLEDEIGDVIASAWFVVEKFGLSRARIAERIRKKTALYRAWDADPDNNALSVDWHNTNAEAA